MPHTPDTCHSSSTELSERMDLQWKSPSVQQTTSLARSEAQMFEVASSILGPGG